MSSPENSEFYEIGIIKGTVREVSGIISTENDELFVIGDSGNEAIIYQLNNDATVIHEISLVHAQNTDWEELQLDNYGTLYAGDIGNNLGQRDDLTIYRISSFTDSISANALTVTDSIRYTYSDQILPAAANSENNFDCEAFIVMEDEIHLFSKNHGSSGYTKRYSLNNSSGIQDATLIDSTLTENWITGAFYDFPKDELYLLSDQDVTVYSNYSKDGLNAALCRQRFSTNQLEGITLNQYNEMLLTEDIEDGGYSKLFKSLMACVTELEITVFPNPGKSFIKWSASNIVYKISILDSTGRLLLSQSFNPENALNGKRAGTIDIGGISSGTYILSFEFLNEVKTEKFIVE